MWGVPSGAFVPVVRACVNAVWMKPSQPCWIGPRDFTCPEAKIDFRVGGSYRAMIKSAQYGENWFSGVYREIVPDKRLIFTFAWENEGPAARAETLVTITFEERNGKTLQTFHQQPFATVERRDSHVGGWNAAFDKQETYAAKIAKEDVR